MRLLLCAALAAMFVGEARAEEAPTAPTSIDTQIRSLGFMSFVGMHAFLCGTRTEEWWRRLAFELRMQADRIAQSAATGIASRETFALYGAAKIEAGIEIASMLWLYGEVSCSAPRLGVLLHNADAIVRRAGERPR